MSLYAALEELLQVEKPAEKLAGVRALHDLCSSEEGRAEEFSAPRVFEQASYSRFCKIVGPEELPRRSRFDTDEGRGALLHAVAHIEYNAIDLAQDHAYRYREAPDEFRREWIGVALEEVEHFEMICSLMEMAGVSYGDLPVHDGLFSAGAKCDSLACRMAVIPRFLEAAGLDANPRIIQRLRQFEDSFSKDMIRALDRILEDEVGHVSRGDRWFRWSCEREGLPVESYFGFVERILPGRLERGVTLNREARVRAGFSDDELDRLAGGRG